MTAHKFDPGKLKKLNDPARYERENPDLIWNALELADPETLVDIGAGTGFFAIPFSRRIRGKVYACDISEELLSWLGEHLPEDVREKVVPIRMEEDSVPLPDGIADLVFMVNLHHELENPGGIFREAARLLKQGGKVAVIDWKKEKTGEGPPVEVRMTEDAIRKDIEAGGFYHIRSLQILAFHNFLVGIKP